MVGNQVSVLIHIISFNEAHWMILRYFDRNRGQDVKSDFDERFPPTPHFSVSSLFRVH